MTILAEIQKWAADLPAWQQHAVALLYERRELEPKDLEDILTLLKISKGIPCPKEFVARTLTAEQVAAPADEQVVVQLKAIKNLKGVNALATGKTLTLSPAGITVIYGDNGAGKSGYSRVLKQACRARDRSERILPNAYIHPVVADTATAEFDTLINGEEAHFIWTDGKASPPELSTVAIFDSRCASAYVDNAGDFSYSPYGLDILEGLAKACGWLKDRVTREQVAARPNVDAFSGLALRPTAAGALAKNLSAKTRKDDVERLATLSDEELTELEALSKTLGEADPKKKAAQQRVAASRVEALAQRIDAALEIVADEKLAEIRALIDKSTNAKAIASAAAKRFEEMDTLEGTGGEAWVEMFNKAREFCATSHAGHDFPRLPAAAKCPLCQNPLGEEGATRLAAFDKFMEGEANKAAKRAHTDAVAAYKAVVEAPLNLAFDDTLAQDLEAVPEIGAACSALQQALWARRDGVRAAATPGSQRTWEDVPGLSPSPRAVLAQLVASLRESAKKLDESLNAEAKAKMEKRKAELDDRRQLAVLKGAALDAIERFNLAAKLGECAAATNTTAISRKSTELTNTMATKEVAEVLGNELSALGVNDIRVAMRPSSAKAKTTFKLVLETQSGDAAQDILSEGEQRAIAIASFLAEVRLGRTLGGVVFDDPVSSLDHGRRERVARRIAAEALERQVIVFTHDIFFLNVLIFEATVLGLEPKALTLNQTPEGFGVAEETLPFAGARVSQRVGMLRAKQVECARLRKNGDEAGYRLLARDLYNDLRMAWERGVEEVLFNEVVLRFRKGIETQRLRKVAVEPEDLAAIAAGMAKCSNYTGHDGAQEANVAPPSPDEMHADIEALEVWRKSAIERQRKR